MQGERLIEKIAEKLDNLLFFVSDNKKPIALLIAMLLAGFLFGVMAAGPGDSPTKETAGGEKDDSITISPLPFSTASFEKSSPHDWVKEDQIHVYKDRIVIDLKNAEWATFTDTNSMDPVIDFGANAIEIVPKNESEIHIGDIISYKSDYASGTIIHRVVETGVDSSGWYCTAKGDNNEKEDPGKIRFSQIQRVVVAVIY